MKNYLVIFSMNDTIYTQNVSVVASSAQAAIEEGQRMLRIKLPYLDAAMPISPLVVLTNYDIAQQSGTLVDVRKLAAELVGMRLAP